jgi:putative resolvase
MFVSIGEASALIGVAVSTLRRWEKEARFQPAFRTKGNHRRYSIDEIRVTFISQTQSQKQRKNICYARVSSHDQKEDLERQKQRLEDYCNTIGVSCETISDLGSGLNYNKKGLNRLINMICSGSVDTLFLTHKDRLLRFGSQLLFKLCIFFGTKIVILDEAKEKKFEEELVGDVIELMTVFCSRIYGRRSHSNRKKAA